MQQSAEIHTKSQLAESDRQWARLEEERKLYELQVQSLRQAMDAMVLRLSTSGSVGDLDLYLWV